MNQIQPFKNLVFKTLVFVHRFLRTLKLTRKNLSSDILIISLHKLGDTTFTISAIKRIIEANNGRKIQIVCFSDSKFIYELEFPNNIVGVRKDWFHFHLFGNSKVKKMIKSFRTNKIYDLTGNILSAYLLVGNKAEEIIGLNINALGGVYTQFYPIDENCHLKEMYLNAVEVKSIINRKNSIELKAFSAKSFNNILIHPFAGWKAKEWGLQNFIDLAELLKNEFNVKFVFKKGEIEYPLNRYLSESSIEVLETQTVGDLIAQIKQSSFLIGNDSGAVNIAVLIGIPTFALFGPVNPKYVLPFEKYHEHIIKDLPCSAKKEDKYCLTYGGRKGCPSYECMSMISVDEVYQKFIEFQAEIRRKYSYN